MNSLFWTVVGLDAVLFIGLLISMLMQGGGSSNGGREMGIAFFVVVPVLIIGLAVLLHVFSRALAWKVVALLIVAGPGLFIAGSRIRSAYIDYVVRQNMLGQGYFAGAPMKAMGAAVVQGDVATLRMIGPTVDVNAPGERGVTLIRLAADQAFEAATPERAQATQSTVRALLKLGAKPGPALDVAIKTKSSAVLRELLKAGADPNQLTDGGHPVVFEWLDTMPVDNMRLLIEHGLNVNVTRYKTPLSVELSLKQRWDLLALLAQNGASLRTPREDGRNVAEEVTRRVSEARTEGGEPSADLLKVQALLEAH